MSKKNRPTPFLTNLVGHEQKKVENPWSTSWNKRQRKELQ